MSPHQEKDRGQRCLLAWVECGGLIIVTFSDTIVGRQAGRLAVNGQT